MEPDLLFDGGRRTTKPGFNLIVYGSDYEYEDIWCANRDSAVIVLCVVILFSQH